MLRMGSLASAASVAATVATAATTASRVPAPAAASKPALGARLRKQQAILLQAETLFARYGFEGVSLDGIASALGISRQNLLYYYRSKEDLYRAVLDQVLAAWLASMEQFSTASDPREALSRYVQSKMRFSQERPSGTAVFTREVMAGMPLYAQALAAGVTPLFRKDIEQLDRWAEQGLIRRVDFKHLLFALWSVTQAYADLSAQFALLQNKSHLDQGDFDAAQQLIIELVWNSLKP